MIAILVQTQYILVLYMTTDCRYIPVSHLNNIYKLYYGKQDHMSEEIIEECTSMMYLAV